MSNKIVKTEEDKDKAPDDRKITFELDVQATKEYVFTKAQLLEKKKKLQSRKITLNQALMENVRKLEDVNAMLALIEQNAI